MLQVDENGAFVTEGLWLLRRHRFTSGMWAACEPVRPRDLAMLETVQRRLPVLVMRVAGCQWWWYRDAFYWEDEELNARVVKELVGARS